MPGRLGDYRIVRKVGQGGMGVVYEAVQESLGRPVALKVLPGHARLSPVQLERFRREARAAARLHHTNIVPVFGVGEAEGVHFYAMQLIRGQGLDRVLDDVRRLREARTPPATREAPADATPGLEAAGRSVAAGLVSGQFVAPTAPGDGVPASPGAPADDPPPESAPPGPDVPSGSEISAQPQARYYRSIARVGVQVAEALAYAHRQGVLHRDIKPSNLLLDVAGMAWIADFGLAKDEGAAGPTEPGDIVGTLRYMAPERYEGRADRRSDIYSLGITLYELLALRPAFDGDRARVIARVRGEDPEPLRSIDPRIPRDLETIVAKAIAKEPDHRYRDADELAADLRRFLEDRPIRARRVGPAERAWRWCRRNRAVAGLLASVATLLVLLAAGSSAAALRFARDAQALRASNDEVKAKNAEGIEKLWHSYLAQARASHGSGRMGQRLDAWTAVVAASDLPPSREPDNALKLRNEAIACMALVDLRVSKEPWRVHTNPSARFIAFDANLERYAHLSAGDRISVRRVSDDGEIVCLPNIGGLPVAQLFRPDGRFLAVQYWAKSGRRFGVWDLESRQRVHDLPSRYHGGAMDFSRDSTQFAAEHADGTIRIYELATGGEVRLPGAPQVQATAFRPDGRWLAVSDGSGQGVQVWDVATRRRVAIFGRELPLFGRIAWSPDGRYLASGAGKGDNHVYVWETSTGRLLAKLEGHKNAVTIVFCHPQFDLLISTGWDGTTRLWDPLSGRPLLVAPGVTVGLSADGHGLAFVDVLDAGIWELAAGKECRTLHGSSGSKTETLGVAFSADGRLLASSSADGVRLWDATTTRELAHLPIRHVEGLAFHPSDGNLIITSGMSSGVNRWPVVADADGGAGCIRVGPPRSLETGPGAHVSLDATGQTLAVLSWGSRREAIVFDLGGRREPLRLAGPLLRYVAISPDGRWVAAGNWHGSGARVWDARTGTPVPPLPTPGAAQVMFSPDHRWLVVSDEVSYRFWEVGSWRPGEWIRRAVTGGAPGPIAFTSDGRVCALARSPDVLQLIEVGTGNELATLQSSSMEEITCLAFNPDGSRLAVGRSREEIQIWDLRRIRSQLATLGLDWGQPAFADEGADEAACPVRSEIDFGDLPEQFPRLTDLREAVLRQEIDDSAEALTRDPSDARARLRRGASLLRRGELRFELGRWTEALEDLDAAVAAGADRVEAHHLRGRARGMLGWHFEALDDFTAALAEVGDDPRRRVALLIGRATAHERLGRYAEAVTDLEAALRGEPSHALAANNLAWLYLTGPGSVRDPAKALPLARRAVQEASANAAYRNTLGVALYRVGRFAEAVEVLEANARQPHQYVAFDWLFQAMARHRRGEAAAARALLDRSLAWRRAQDGLPAATAAEFDAFRAEAEAVLKGPPGP